MIDKNAMENYITNMVRGERKVPLFAAANQFMKIYTTDLMLR